MDKEQQDLAWACLPKEARDRIKIAYKSDYVSDRGYQPTRGMEVLQNVFGHHNLTSDTKLKKVMVIPLQAFCSLCADADDYINEHITEDSSYEYYQGRSDALHELASYKCLPDKELNEENFAKSDLEHRLEQTSVQVEPRFRKGDKVRFKDSYYKEELHGKVGIIAFVNTESECYVVVDNTIYCARESDLEPYVEPKFKVGDKVYQTVGHNRLDEYTVKKVYTDKNRGIVYDIQGLIGIMGIEENKLCLTCQTPTPNQKQKRMLHVLTSIVWDRKY